MSECTDTRFQKLLHLYELDLLEPDQKEQFEVHLYACDHCFEAVRQFREETLLLRHDPDLRETVDRIARAHEKEAAARRQPEPARASRKRPWPALVPVAAAAAVVLLILILKPWHVEFRPTQEARAVENRLAVMFFNNLADPDDSRQWGEIFTNLLITDLAESQFVQVVSSQRIADILYTLGHTDYRIPDRGVATRVAEAAGARWMLIGAILQETPHIELTTELVAVETGAILASSRITGTPDDDLFTLADKLTVNVKEDLSLPAAARNEPDPPVADVTTHSAEAYRYYLEGVEFYDKYFKNEARESFQRAIEHDSTFAMAHYYLAFLADARHLDKAIQYLDRTSRKERFYIVSLRAAHEGNTAQAVAELQTLLESYPDDKMALHRIGTLYYQQKQFDSSIVYLNRAIDIDPFYKAGYNLLAYAYNQVGDLENALWAINRYIELVPDEPNPYDSRGDLYAANGKPREAIASYLAALERKPDFLASVEKLGNIYFILHEYDDAEAQFHKLLAGGSPVQKEFARLMLASEYAARGKLRASVRALDSCITLGGTRETAQAPAYLIRIKAFIELAIGDMDAALADIMISMNRRRELFPDDPAYNRMYYAQFLAAAGDISAADSVVDALRLDLEKNEQLLFPYQYAAGAVALEKKDPNAAIGFLEPLVDAVPNDPAQYLLGRAYLEAGMLSKAVDKFEEQLVSFHDSWRICFVPWSIKSHYYLGLAYERSQWTDKAAERFETFLHLWRDADPGIPEIEDARERLTRLRTGT